VTQFHEGVLLLAAFADQLPASQAVGLAQQLTEDCQILAGHIGSLGGEPLTTAYQQLNAAREQVEEAQAAIEGCRESLHTTLAAFG
jgi:hypothetical protein